MNRSAIDVVKRGLANVLANWPLLLIRIAESVVLLIIVMVSVVAMIVPVAISLGMTKFDPRGTDNAAMVLDIIVGHWGVLLFLLVGISILLTVILVVHGFVQGAATRIYLEGERKASGGETLDFLSWRTTFEAFSPDRWFAGGRETWWPIFWIYNLAWGLAALIILLPLMAVILVAAFFVIRSGSLVTNPETAAAGTIVAGCATAVLLVFFTVVVCVITSVWSYKAIVIAVDQRIGARPALSAAWRAFRADAGRNLVVLFLLFVAAVGGSMILGTIGAGFNFTHRLGNVALMLLPAQIAVSLVQSIFSAFMDSWLTASFASLQAENAPSTR